MSVVISPTELLYIISSPCDVLLHTPQGIIFAVYRCAFPRRTGPATRFVPAISTGWIFVRFPVPTISVRHMVQWRCRNKVPTACWIQTAIVAFLSTSCPGLPFPPCLRTTTNPRIKYHLEVAPTMALRLVPNAWHVPDLILVSFHLGM